MNTKAEELLAQIDRTPCGPEERTLIDEVIALATESGDGFLEYQARIRLTSSAFMTGDTDAMLSSFTWCLAQHDADPQKYPLKLAEGYDLLWQFKWLASTLSNSPIFSLSEIAAVLDDMQQRYLRAGVGKSAVLQARFQEAWDNGRLEEAAALREELLRTPRDEYSHCDACTRSSEASYLNFIGEHSQALQKFEEIFEENLSCGTEPEYSLAAVLLPYLRSAQFDKAKSSHFTGYRLAKMSTDNIYIISKHLIFCAITGNEARGLSLLERHISWLAHDTLDASSHFSTLSSFALLLDAVTKAGHGDAIVRGAESPDLVVFFQEHEGSWRASELAEACWAAAERLARAFNERNGNEYYTALVQRTRALSAEHYDLSLGSEQFFTQPESKIEPDPVDFHGWLVRAREQAVLGDYEAVYFAAESALKCIEHGKIEYDPIDRVSAHDLLVKSLISRGLHEEGAAAQAKSFSYFRSIGWEEYADAQESLGSLWFSSAETAEDAAVLQDYLNTIEAKVSSPVFDRIREVVLWTLTDFFRQEGSHAEAKIFAQRAVDLVDPAETDYSIGLSLIRLALSYTQNGEQEEALTVLTRLLATETHRALRAKAFQIRATVYAYSREFESALSDAEAALALYSALGSRSAQKEVCVLSARVLADSSRMDESLARWRLALWHAELEESSDLDDIRFSYAQQLVLLGRGTEAIEIFDDVSHSQTQKNVSAASLGDTLLWLGYAYQQAEQHGTTYSSWKRAIRMYDEAQETEKSAEAGRSLGQLLLNFGDEEACEVLERAVQQARNTPQNSPLLIVTLDLWGRAQCFFAQPAGLETLDEAQKIADQIAENSWFSADIADSRARSLAQLGRVDEAIPVALTAADRFLAAGDVATGGSVEAYAARLLISQNRREEALPLFYSAIKNLESFSEAQAAIQLELADALEALGRHAEAAQLRSPEDNP